MNEGHILLKASRRESGKKAAKAVRKQDKVPGIFYVKTGESIPFSVNPLDIRDVVYTSKTKIINLQLEGEDDIRECVLKSVDFDPVTDKVSHLDFYGIVGGQTMTVEVPVRLVGTARGIRDGGLLQRTLRRILVECFPKDLPSVIELDVANLGLGDAIYVKDIKIPNVELLASPEISVVSVIQPRIAKEGEAEVKKEGETADAAAKPAAAGAAAPAAKQEKKGKDK